MLNKQLLIKFFNLAQNSMYEFYPNYSQNVSIGLSPNNKEVIINQHLYISKISIRINSGNSTGEISFILPDGTLIKKASRSSKDTFDFSAGDLYLPKGSKIKVANLNYPEYINVEEVVCYPISAVKFNRDGFTEIIEGGGRTLFILSSPIVANLLGQGRLAFYV